MVDDMATRNSKAFMPPVHLEVVGSERGSRDRGIRCGWNRPCALEPSSVVAGPSRCGLKARGPAQCELLPTTSSCTVAPRTGRLAACRHRGFRPTESFRPSRRPHRLFGRFLSPIVALGLLSALLQVVPACAEPPKPRDYQAHLARVQAAFDRAQERWRRESNSVEAAWTFGRATFDWAEFATNDHQRSTLAELGIAACRRGVALESTNVAAHYYLGLNLGQLARTKLLGALKLIDEMEAQWTNAIRLDPHFDYGGPHRALGVLYRDAPGWPTSIGSQKKSRQNLEAALKLHPEYPGNVITLQEGLVEWGSKKTVRDRVKETETFLKKARELFQGEAWAWDWEDWDQRWAAVKRKAGL